MSTSLLQRLDGACADAVGDGPELLNNIGSTETSGAVSRGRLSLPNPLVGKPVAGARRVSARRWAAAGTGRRGGRAVLRRRPAGSGLLEAARPDRHTIRRQSFRCRTRYAVVSQRRPGPVDRGRPTGIRRSRRPSGQGAWIPRRVGRGRGRAGGRRRRRRRGSPHLGGPRRHHPGRICCATTADHRRRGEGRVSRGRCAPRSPQRYPDTWCRRR